MDRRPKTVLSPSSASNRACPARAHPKIEHIPQELRGRDQWVCWKYVQRGDKWTKRPIAAASGKAASSTDRSTWTDFANTLTAFEADRELAGIGFVFAADDPYAGIDLDDCISGDGTLSEFARSLIESLGSYAEISPSGRGVKVFVKGSLGEKGLAGRRSKTFNGLSMPGVKEIEVYDSGRYFTVTGHVVEGGTTEITECQTELESLYESLSVPPASKQQWTRTRDARPKDPAREWRSAGGGLDDDRVIEAATRAVTGAQFRELMDGDLSRYGGDASSADLALCNMLAFWCGRDPSQMDRVFRRSRLMRDKWDERRGARTYGEMTLARAIEGCTEVYTPSRTGRSREVREEGAATEPDEGDADLPALGRHDPATGRLVLSAKQTLPTAEAYVRAFHSHPDGPTLLAHGGVLLEWAGNRYDPVEEQAMRHRLQPWLHGALRVVYDKRTGRTVLRDFESNPTTVKQAYETIVSHVHLNAGVMAPAWLGDVVDAPPATELLACRSVNLHIPTGRTLEATPRLFTMNALDFDYDPDPEPPERWVKFLEQLFGDDLESVSLLQEWMGYCLTADTSQQKMLLIVGPRRSGKGTLARVVTRLVGAGNVVGPTTGSLASPFGLQPLIGKSLAIVSDARFSGEGVGTVVERLLCISGEDTLTIDRKYLGAVSVKLPTGLCSLRTSCRDSRTRATR